MPRSETLHRHLTGYPLFAMSIGQLSLRIAGFGAAWA